MTKSQEGTLQGASLVSSRLLFRGATPPPTLVDENKPPETSTPDRLDRLLKSADELSRNCPDTPSRHMSKPKAGGIQDLDPLVIVTLVAHQFIQKLPPEALNGSPCISSHLDFIYSNIAFQEVIVHSPTPETKYFTRRVFTHDAPLSPEGEGKMVTKESQVFFPSKAYTAKICSLGAYEEIGGRFIDLKKNYKISDQGLAEYIENIYNKDRSPSLNFNPTDSKFLLDFSTLLYATEGHRHQSAYIIHKMFMDLVKAGGYLFGDMRAILPMAIVGAVPTTIMLDKILFSKDLKNVSLYYDKSSKLTTSQDTIEEFVFRSNQIVADWLDQKEFSGSTPQEKYYFIKEHLVDWYGDAVIPQDSTKDIESPSLDENDSYKDSPYQNTRKRKASSSEYEPLYKRQQINNEEDSDTSVLDAESGYEGSPTLSQTSDRMGLTEAEVRFKASLPTALQLSESSPSSSQASLLPDADLTGESWGGWVWNYLFG